MKNFSRPHGRVHAPGPGARSLSGRVAKATPAWDAHTPTPVEGLAEAIGFNAALAVPLIVLIGGIVGGLGGVFSPELVAMAVDYPINVGGRPLHSWPAYIPITFELTILCAALSVLSVCSPSTVCRNRAIPFSTRRILSAPRPTGFLRIEARDPKFDRTATRQMLESFHPVTVSEVMA